jgi:hypothetical protein
MRKKLVNPLTVAVALCLALMTYVAIRPMPDRSLRLTLIFHEQGGRSAATPWRNTQDILARWETGAETHVIDPSEIVAYVWSVHALHLSPAGSERLRAQVGGADVQALADELVRAQPAFVLTVGHDVIIAGVIAPQRYNDRYFLGQKAQPVVEQGALRIVFELSDQFIEAGTVADRRLYEAIQAGGLSETCSSAGAPFEIRVSTDLPADRHPFHETPAQTLARLTDATTVVRLTVDDIARYHWPSGSFTVTPAASQMLITTLGLPADDGAGPDSNYLLTLAGYLEGSPIWVGQTRFLAFAPADDVFSGAKFWVTAQAGQLTFEARETPTQLDTLRGLRNVCVRDLFMDAGRLSERPAILPANRVASLAPKRQPQSDVRPDGQGVHGSCGASRQISRFPSTDYADFLGQSA